ncbi:MAG TPA: hypothetical protein VES73_11300 [Lamprocystis sp. (in: g-proteobacteria)]|nr:hypothetical protein [Lamprocystis sp. (in: g-proteobacteria)]
MGNPDCEQYRRPVPLLMAMRERNPALVWGVVGVFGLALVALLLSAVLGGGGWQDQLEGLRAELAVLDSRLNDLLNQPAPSAPTAPATADLERLDEQVKRFTQAVDQAVNANVGQPAVSPLLEQGNAIKSELDSLRASGGPNPAAATLQFTA